MDDRLPAPNDVARAQLAALGHAPVGVAFLDAALRFVQVNAALAALNGLAAEAHLGRTVDALFPWLPPVVGEALARVRDGGAPESLVAVRPAADGGLGRSWRFSAFPVDGGAGGVGVVVVDETAQHRAEERTRRLQTLGAALSAALGPEEMARAVVREARAALGAHTAAVLRVHDGALALVAEAGHAPDVVRHLSRPRPLDVPAPLTDALRTRQPVLFETPEERARAYPALATLHPSVDGLAWAHLPLALEDRALGVLALTFPVPRRFGPDDRELFGVVARQCAQALERARLYGAERAAREEAQAAAERLRTLSEVSRALASQHLELSGVLDALVRQVAERVSDGCLLALVREDGQGLEVAALHHPSPEMREALRRLFETQSGLVKEGLGAQVLRQGETLLLDPGVADEIIGQSLRPGFHAVAATHPVSGLLVVPVRLEGRVQGVLYAARHPPRGGFDAGDQVLLEEIADRAGLAIANARLYAREKRAVRAREEVLAVVSHDLRNPAQSIRVLAGSLRRPGGGDGARLVERATRIERTAERMERLLQDLLDLASLDAGRLGLACVAQPVGAVLADALEPLEPLALEREVVLEALPVPDTVRVLCDRGRVGQVVGNLVGNALKFTPAGGRVRVEVEPREREVVVRVRDTGPGIPPEQQAHVFEPYWKGPGAATKGAGLGLAIARGLVEAHGGRLEVSSHPGEGAEFFFTLPRA